MDNIYGKKLPGTTLPSASGSDYLLAETSDGKLNWIDSTGAKELADKPWANSTFLTPSTVASTYVPMQFTLSGATHYIGKEVSLDISSGTTVLTNCSGTVVVSGNSAKVYINNSPDLTVTGITSENWRNVYIDGVAEWTISNTTEEIYGDGNYQLGNYKYFTNYSFQATDVCVADCYIGRVANTGASYVLEIPFSNDAYVTTDTAYVAAGDTPLIVAAKLTCNGSGLFLTRLYPNTASYSFRMDGIKVRRYL